MCSSNFERERTKPYSSTCVSVADFLLSHRDVACRMWCSRLRASRRLWLPFIASLHYINSPKLAKSCQRKLGKSCQNNKGAEYYCLSSCWICSQYDDPLTNGIVSNQNQIKKEKCTFCYTFLKESKNRPLFNTKQLGGGGGNCEFCKQACETS